MRDDANFKKIFINPDKTLNERVLEKKLREERDKRNNALPLAHENGRRYKERNGKKLYWGIRWGELQLVECQ